MPIAKFPDNDPWSEFEGMELSAIRKVLHSRGKQNEEIKKIITEIDDFRIQEEYLTLQRKKAKDYLRSGWILISVCALLFFGLYLYKGPNHAFTVFCATGITAGYFLVKKGQAILSDTQLHYHNHIRNSFSEGLKH